MELKDFKDRLGRNVDDIKSDILKLGTYDIEKINNLPEQNGVGLVLRHKKTKARFSSVLCDDDNKVFAIGYSILLNIQFFAVQRSILQRILL